MSHISIFKHKITDLNSLKKVCLGKGITFTQVANGKVTGEFYRDQTHSGVAKIELSKWRYPLIIDEEGRIHYDNFGSQTGSMDQFGDLLQDYNMEVVKQNIDTTLWDNITIEQQNGDIQMKLTIY
ncbi:MAG: hypothetical protein PVG39_00620 [Desulfobacteraceae bacterium]|jgi:hypothetical protein